MNTAEQKRDPLRYRLYYRLMDICLVVTIIGLLEVLVLEMSGFKHFGLPRAFDIPFNAFLVAFTLIGPFVLFAAKFMRDDYAEQLWRRAVVILAYGVCLVPVALFIIFNTALVVLGQDGMNNGLPSWLTVEWGVASTIYLSSFVYMLLFMFIFQFLRWRDSR